MPTLRALRPLALLACAACATAQATPPSARPAAPARARSAPRSFTQPRAIVLRHATVLPASGPAIEDGAVAFAGGRLVAVGRSAEVATPPGAEELDARGRFVTPGLIDAHSHLGVYASPEASFANADGNEATAPVTAEVDAAHSFWPQDPGLRRAAAGGVTALLSLPGSANLIGGRGFPVKLHFGTSAEEVRFPGAPDALKMACGENPKRVYGKERKAAPSTRMGSVAGYRQAFANAKDYLARLEAWQERRALRGAEVAGPAPARDLKLETLAGVLRGEILVQNHCYRADEMRVMLDVADEFGFKIRTFHHALEAYKVREVLAQKEVAVATWADWFGFKLEAWDGIPWNAGLIEAAGARAIIHSDSADGIQRLNQEAAKALFRAREAGLAIPDEAALRWITLNPAWAMGVDALTGSLDPGKQADVVLWDRHPFSGYARALRVWADGVVTYDAKTGPAEPSDFEVGEAAASWARLSPAGAQVPELPARADAQELPLEAGDCVLFSGVTVLSAGEVRPHQLVWTSGGRVARVLPLQAAEAPPASCRRVEGSGLVLTSGLIEPDTMVGLAEVLAEEPANDLGPRKPVDPSPVHAALRAVDSLNPASALLPVLRAGGLTAVVAAPSGGLVSGQSAALALDGSVLHPRAALLVRLGVAGHDAVGSTRGAALQAVRELFDDARFYAQRRADFERNALRKVAASRLDLEALQDALAGRQPVVIEANRESDVRTALALAAEYRLRAIVRGGAEAWRVAPELARAKVPVLMDPTEDLPQGFDSLAARPDGAALLARAGVSLLFSTFSHDRARALAQSAANAVAWGVPHGAALAAVTSNVADAFGLDTGRVQAGARADLVLWSGDPLELSSRPLGMWIGGKQVGLQSRQHALLEKYRRGAGRAP